MIKIIKIAIDNREFARIPLISDLREGIIYTFSAQIKKEKGEYSMTGYQLEDQSQPQMYQASSHINCPPDDLDAQKWEGKMDTKTSTFATLHIGHEIENSCPFPYVNPEK